MATIQSVFFNLFYNAIPIIIAAIPLIFGRKKSWGKMYERIFYGIVVYFFIYMILPAMLPTESGGIDTMNNGAVSFSAGFIYILSRTGALILNYFQYPLYILPFIFVFGPLISVLFLWLKLRKEDGGFRKSLNELTIEIDKSPKEMIIAKLKSGNWSDEKQLFKLMVVLLPISLYLLTSIFKIGNLELYSITDGSAVGWFLEIFFVYLATFLFGIHLLKASKTSFKGRFLGEKLVDTTSSSLTTVGIPMSAMSILLFLIEYPEQLMIIVYFFGYFIMASFIFVTYLVLFEPVCIILLVKILTALKIKERKEKNPLKNDEYNKKDYSGLGMIFLFAILSVTLLFLMFFVVESSLIGLITGGEDIFLVILNSINFDVTQTLSQANTAELINIIQSARMGLIVLVIGFFLSYAIKNSRSITLSSLIFFIILAPVTALIFSNIFFATGSDTFFLTGKLVGTDTFSDVFEIFLVRTATLPTNFDNLILQIIAGPYVYTIFFLAFFLWGITFYYSSQKFFTKLIKPEGSKYVEQTTFSNLEYLPSESDFFSDKMYLITLKDDIKIPDDERDEIKEYSEILSKGKNTNFLKLNKSEEEQKRLYTILRYMSNKKWLNWWAPEFNFTFERAEIDALYVMYSDGRDVFSHMFTDSTKTDPALVAGMFSAITSFIKETTKSTDFLRTIDHGDSTITIEYGKHVFGAIFANMETNEIRSKLKKFVEMFEEKHADVLVKWSGLTTPFKDDVILIQEIFEE